MADNITSQFGRGGGPRPDRSELSAEQQAHLASYDEKLREGDQAGAHALVIESPNLTTFPFPRA